MGFLPKNPRVSRNINIYIYIYTHTQKKGALSVVLNDLGFRVQGLRADSRDRKVGVRI